MFEKELEAAIKAGLLAKDKILEIYQSPFDVEIKSDNSPVTLADKTADKMIREYLSNLFPNYAFLTEESEDNLSRLENDYVWIVDPVDGTKDFVAKDDEFTTNIALSYQHEIVVGVVIIPAKNQIYYASKDHGSFSIINGITKSIHVNDKKENLTCLTSIFHSTSKEEELISKNKPLIKYVKKVGSSLKACLIASGEAEIFYRLSEGTKEWDTAAIQIIVEEAGGIFIKPDGQRMKYNRQDVYNHDGYIIANCLDNIKI